MGHIFVTGATGWIGKHLVPGLLSAGHKVTVLIRSAAHDDLLAGWAKLGNLRSVRGDVTTPTVASAPWSELDHVVHLAGLYDLDADVGRLEAVNVTGTENLIAALLAGKFTGVLHHASSVAVAGDFEGEFCETHFDEGQKHPHAYQRTKFEAERRVREATGLRWRIYRPSAVVGHSRTGDMDRVDGPYLLFLPIRKTRDTLPSWFPLYGWLGGQLNMVPVDFVADAFAGLIEAPGLDGQTFHLVDPDPPPFRYTYNLIAAAAGAPRMKGNLKKALSRVFPGVPGLVGGLGSVQFYRRHLLERNRVPLSVPEAMNEGVVYGAQTTKSALDEVGVRCPRQDDYIPVLWDYWLRNLDPGRNPEIRWTEDFTDKRVLVTGASSGIGAAFAEQAAACGAKVMVVARRQDRLDEVVSRIRAKGGQARAYAADLSEPADCDALMERVMQDHGGVDVLVNNAARSIRRPLAESIERFHDFERLMKLNYFAPLRLIRAVLPGMRERGSGFIVNVVTAGVALPTPNFGAYASTKAALAHMTGTLGAELLHEGVYCSSIYYPWVRTDMVSDRFQDTKALSAEQAAGWIMRAVVDRKAGVMDATTRRRWMFYGAMPEGIRRVLNILYRIEADEPGKYPEFTADRMLLRRFVKGKLM